jgi:hypothetical protein
MIKMQRYKFIFFKSLNCSPCTNFYNSEDWAALTRDPELKQYYDFECIVFDSTRSNPLLELEGQYTIAYQNASPLFCIETPNRLVNLGNIRYGRNYQNIKKQLLDILKTNHLK